MSVQYRVVVAKKDERIDGPDDADIVRGKLKAAGHTGQILDLLKSGEASAAIAALAATI
jgi:hypothetical protein